jgi:hypothetical protein
VEEAGIGQGGLCIIFGGIVVESVGRIVGDGIVRRFMSAVNFRFHNGFVEVVVEEVFAAGAVGEGEVRFSIVAIGPFVNKCNDVIGHREDGEVAADNDTAGGEAEESVGTLHIARRAKADGGLGSAGHGVEGRGFFMDFAIGAEFRTAMLGCTEARAIEEFAWAVDRRNAHLGREIVEPHGEEVEEVDKDHVGKASEGHGGKGALGAFFDCANPALNLCHVLIGGSSVEDDIRDELSEFLEFAIHDDGLDLEASACVVAAYLMDEGSKLFAGAGWGELDSKGAYFT